MIEAEEDEDKNTDRESEGEDGRRCSQSAATAVLSPARPPSPSLPLPVSSLRLGSVRAALRTTLRLSDECSGLIGSRDAFS